MDEREVFLAVVEANGFSAAARRLNSTPAVISRRIKSLEQRLGVRLLQRTTRKLRLTQQGERYYREISNLLGQLNHLEQELTETSRQPRGELRITAPMSFGQRRLAPIVTQFALRYPALRLSVTLEDQETDIVAEGYDLAIRITHPQDTSLVGRAIAPVPRCICASPKYLNERGTPVSPADLADHDCLHFSLISAREEWRFTDAQNPVINTTFSSNNGEVLAKAAIDGLGITLLPEFIVEDALTEGSLVRVLNGMEQPPLTLYVMYPSRKHVPTKTKLFVNFIIEQLGND